MHSPVAVPDVRRPLFDLFLISFLVLFLELLCIRWFPAHVIFLSFFTNILLLAAFVGMSIGCLTASHARNHLRLTPIWLLIAFALGTIFELFRKQLERKIDVGNQRSPEVVFFGAELGAKRELSFGVPIEVVAGLFFVMAALILIGPGQELGRAFNRVANRGRAYALNLLGSIGGIVLFAGMSFFHLPPVAWLLPACIGLLYFLERYPSAREGRGWLRPVALLFVLMIASDPPGWFTPLRATMWSPYYRVDHDFGGDIRTNLVGHQRMWDTDQKSGSQAPQSYAFPHLLNRDAGGKPFERVLIIGAGSGNDLSRALQWGNENTRIDAVEIDPVIQGIGREAHPNHPYSDARVNAILNDGRNHLRTLAREQPGQFDVVIYAVVDSLVLHSGYSNIRLESFLFTKEAFDDIRTILKPGGVFVVSNYFRQGFIVARLRDTLRDTFQSEPVILTIPPKTELNPDELFDGFTMFVAGSKEATAPLALAFERDEKFRLRGGDIPRPGQTANGFRARPTSAEIAADGWIEFPRTRVGESAGLRPPTDDWPFLYQREASIPDITLRGMGLVLGLTLAMMAWFLWPKRRLTSVPAATKLGFDSRMFFLGAGFMLVETAAVVQMALVFGSTWLVNVFVFLGVLMLSLAANFVAMRLQMRNLTFCYVGLFATIGLNLLVGLNSFLGSNELVRIVGSCALVLSPLFFAGLIFATSFARRNAPDRAFGFNVMGALVGGLAENASLALGFRNLLFLAAGIYLSSIWERNFAIRRDTDPVREV